MVKETLKIDGMSCPMCEAHIADTLRSAFPVKKVKASRRKGLAEFVCESEISFADLKKVLDPTGCRLESASAEPYERHGLFH